MCDFLRKSFSIYEDQNEFLCFLFSFNDLDAFLVNEKNIIESSCVFGHVGREIDRGIEFLKVRLKEFS